LFIIDLYFSDNNVDTSFFNAADNSNVGGSSVLYDKPILIEELIFFPFASLPFLQNVGNEL